ncbi:hypothetical protein ACUN7V_00565 [Quadrisphaera oryzae]|uniref:hypothetical protein n=1 Tax=Quadrisphaera TaxID=317661 RepID=UPI0016493EEF|nr:hypothetical protein [Quadrisphaera sp. RL12-1S]MBC3763068.1 hypothetical protein [Quadrisphaera sp. RL12-1S]
MLVALVMSATGAGETASSEPFPPLVFGLIAFAVFLLLLGILWAFRSVGNRH